MTTSTMQYVTRGSLLAAVLTSSLLVTSCAMSPSVPPGAEQVRGKLTALQQNPDLSERARIEIRAAEVAVRIAEQPVSDTEAELGKHRVYMADRAVEIAEARAATKYAEDQRLRLGEDRDAARLQARTQEVDRARDEASRARTAELAAQSLQADAAAAAMQQSKDYQRQIEALEAEITDRGVVLTLGDVLFATGSSDLQKDANNSLNKLVSFLNQYPDRQVLIEGHTDDVGSVEFNRGLSERRAESVRGYLRQQGIASRRLATAGLGMERPVANNGTAAGRQQNRRVEIIIENPPGPGVR
ncbi:MAG: OmpA family protein [Pseudomonadota bacterium]|nr:OmpA family protein [Pseudomonadota bacterium]